jgi:DNA ligase-associated metallophosphoesterase
MDKSRIEIMPGVWLDHRRAVFLEKESILAVADLHLGYAWAQRYNGQMLPLHTQDDLLARLSDLCAVYQPQRLAILGDIVHQAVPVTEISDELSALFEKLAAICGLKLILGNHDKKLRKFAKNQNLEFLTHFEAGRFLLTHGNELAEVPPKKFVLMGHEHPAISLGDGIASAKFACFLVGRSVLILPAFSLWSAGTNIRAYPFMSSLAQNSRFNTAVAICGTKLLPVKLN